MRHQIPRQNINQSGTETDVSKLSVELYVWVKKSKCRHDYAEETLSETKDCLSNITGEMPKPQKFTGEHQQFKISLGVTQITNIHRGGKKSKPFSPGTDFVGLIFTGELSRVDSAGVLRQGVVAVVAIRRIFNRSHINGGISYLLYLYSKFTI